MGKFNLRIGKKKQNDESDPTSPTSSISSPEEAPKLALNSLALDSATTKTTTTTSFAPARQERPQKNLLDEILGELNAPSENNDSAGLQSDFSLAFELSRRLDISSNEPSRTTPATTANTSFLNSSSSSSFLNSSSTFASTTNVTKPSDLYARFNLPTTSGTSNTLATTRAFLSGTTATAAAATSSVTTNGNQSNGNQSNPNATRKPLDSDEETESEESSEEDTKKKKKKNKKNASKKTKGKSRPGRQRKRKDSDEETESDEDSESSDDEKKPARVDPAVLRKKEAYDKLNAVGNWVQEVDPKDAEDNVLDRMKDRHRVEARALVNLSSQAGPPAPGYVDDDRHYEDYGYDPRYDPRMPRAGPAYPEDRDEYRHGPMPRDPRMPPDMRGMPPAGGGYMDDRRDDYRLGVRDPRDMRDNFRGNGYADDHRDEYRYGPPRQGGMRGPYMDEREDYRMRNGPSRGRVPDIAYRREDRMGNSRRAQQSASPGPSAHDDDEPLSRYQDERRVPSSSASSRSSESSASDPNTRSRGDHGRRYPTSGRLTNQPSFARERLRDEIPTKSKSRSNMHSPHSSISSARGETPFRDNHRDGGTRASTPKNGHVTSRRSSGTSSSGSMPRQRRLEEPVSKQRSSPPRSVGSSDDKDDYEPLGARLPGPSAEVRRRETEPGSRRLSGQSDNPRSPTGTHSTDNNSRGMSDKSDRKTPQSKMASSDSSSSEDDRTEESHSEDSDDEQPLGAGMAGVPPPRGLPAGARQHEYYGQQRDPVGYGGRSESDYDVRGGGGRYGPPGGYRDDGPGRYPPREPPVGRYHEQPPGRYGPPAYRDDGAAAYDGPNNRHGPYPVSRDEPPYEPGRRYGGFTQPPPPPPPIVEQPAVDPNAPSQKVPLIEMAGYRYDQNKRGTSISPLAPPNQPFLSNYGRSTSPSPAPTRWTGPAPAGPRPGGPGAPPGRGAYPPDRSGYSAPMPPERRGGDYAPAAIVPSVPPARGAVAPPRGYNGPMARGGYPAKGGYDGQYYGRQGYAHGGYVYDE